MSEDQDEPVELPLEDELDLHSFAPRDVADVVTEWLEAVRGRFGVVTIIHGRGRGVQRRIVHSILDRTPWVAGYHDSVRGNWGATVAHLSAGDDQP